MIRLIENSLTKNKHVVNFMDHFGKVLGFKPEPDGFPISWRLYDEELNDLCNEEECSKFLQDYLANLPYTFGEYTVMKCEQNRDGNLEELSIRLIPDDKSQKSLILFVEFFAQGFYTAEFSLDPSDKEFFNNEKSYCHIQSSMETEISNLFKEYEENFNIIKEKITRLDDIKDELKKIFSKIEIK